MAPINPAWVEDQPVVLTSGLHFLKSFLQNKNDILIIIHNFDAGVSTVKHISQVIKILWNLPHETSLWGGWRIFSAFLCCVPTTIDVIFYSFIPVEKIVCLLLCLIPMCNFPLKNTGLVILCVTPVMCKCGKVNPWHFCDILRDGYIWKTT